VFAIAFDLVVADALEHHPKGVRAAYDEVEQSLLQFEFKRVQGSVFLSESEDLANLMLAMNALKALPWFPKVVRDIRAFRVEQWSDFTGFMKG
jgi:virulence-associated protein VapD